MLATDIRPKFFRDYVGQGNKKGGKVDVLKKSIEVNKHKHLFIGAPPGVGKTTLALLYARATLCPNRLEGEHEPCGDCEVCNGEDNSNIHHYTITNSTEAREPFNQLIAASYQHPVTLAEREDQTRRFIIIDEFELASSELAAKLLGPMEHSPPSTTWIIVTMNPEKLEPITREAIQSRCSSIYLSRLSEDDLATALTHRTSIDYSAALMLAKVAEGNMRMALNHLDFISTLYPVEDLTEELLTEYFYGSAGKENRVKFWQALAEGNGKLTRSLLSNWESEVGDIKIIAKLLQEDILDAISKPHLGTQQLLASLSRWASSPHAYPIASVFMSHLETDIYQAQEAKQEPAIPLPKVEVKVVSMEEAKKKFSKKKNPFAAQTFEELRRMYA